MIKIMKELRKNVKDTTEDLNVPVIYFEETRRADNSPCLMPLVALKTEPCSWFVNCGGCTMCGYQLATSQNKRPTRENLINQTRYTIRKLSPETYPLITFNAAGNFLNPKEISDSLRPVLLGMLKKAGFKEFNFECRPEFLLNEERVSQLKDYFDIVSVGIGLESSDDFIRNDCLNKGTRIETYLKAARILKRHVIEYDAYIQLGKPFLTAREDVEDAVKTAEFAFENGFTNVILMLCNIQPHTLTHWLWKRNMYEPPMLWASIEVVKRLPRKHRSSVFIKGFNRAEPIPLQFPSNCGKCNMEVADRLVHWNLTGDIEHLDNMPDCECLKVWEQKMNKKPELGLKERHAKMKSYIKEELKG